MSATAGTTAWRATRWMRSGTLTALGHTPSGGNGPRGFDISPEGRWLVCAHQHSNDVFVFEIDPLTGDLRPNAEKATVPASVCSEIADGVTILVACRDNEVATESDGQGVFTSLLIEALGGQCADLIGHISPGSVYAFIDRALGEWEQRPMFKTNISSFISIRNVAPPIETSLLRKIADYFPSIYDEFKLDPTFEDTVPGFNPNNVKMLKELQKMVRVGLVKPVDEEHMYYAAIKSTSCKLTALGAQYWRIVKSNKI